jgi:accessory gene regulator protein AgrB
VKSFIPTVNGNFAVHLTDGLGCTAQSECFFVMITGLEDDFNSNNRFVYPNPAKAIVYIKIKPPLPLQK